MPTGRCNHKIDSLPPSAHNGSVSSNQLENTNILYMNTFQLNCKKCPRLAASLRQIRIEHPNYHAKPVPPFGELSAALQIVGLAPGLHGANATGRPFTGDHAGILLYATLHKFGFANKAQSVHQDDGLKLINCRITNAVKCLPPQNKPLPLEIKTCNQYLRSELNQLSKNSVILALGTVAHKAILIALDLKTKEFPFIHHNIYRLHNSCYLVDCYHCSRYNTQTKRLTTEMFEAVFKSIRKLINKRMNKSLKKNAEVI